MMLQQPLVNYQKGANSIRTFLEDKRGKRHYYSLFYLERRVFYWHNLKQSCGLLSKI